MTTQTLSHVTLETLENYRTAATQAVMAYRAGSHRLVDAVNEALQQRLYPRTAKLAPRATERMDGVRGEVTQIVVKGIDQIAERTGQAIELGSTAAADRVTQVARFAAGIDNELAQNGLQAAVRLTLPGAKVALAVSGKVAEGASALAEAAGAHLLRKAVRKTAAAAKRRAAPATRKVKAIAKTAPVAKAKRVVRATRKAVAEAAAA